MLAIMKRIYLDYAASSPLAPGVLEAMLPYLESHYANPHALYTEGKQARVALEEARAVVATAIGTAPPELVFCSGGTEADNAAIAGIAQAVRRRKGAQANHVICSAFEHPAVLESVKALKSSGFDVTLLRPTRDGFITPETLKSAITNSTIVVSIMATQNEIGTIQPISELAAVAHEHGALFHTDAVAALGKRPFDVQALGVDAASFSAHKIGGPKGAGALFIKQTTPFETQMRGGGQEGTRRSGTQDVAGAVGFAAAAVYSCDLGQCNREAARLTVLRDYLTARLIALDIRLRLSVPIIPGDSTHHIPGIVSCTVDRQESEMLLLRLDEAGIAVSGGSACSSGSLEPSHTLLSLGIPKDRAFGALRFSLGEQTTRDDIDTLLGVLSGILST